MEDSSQPGGPDGLATWLASLEAIGVSLWLDQSQVRYRAPKGVMTPERLATLRERRAEIQAFLLASAEPGILVPDPQRRHEPFPLTDVQTAYLVGRGGGYPWGGVGCHGYGELLFTDIEIDRLESAWAALVRRHDMLRAVIEPDGTQRVLPDPPSYRIRAEDLRGEPPERILAATLRTRAEMDHRVYQAGEWPLFDLRLTIGDGSATLHFSIDFLIADFVSIQLILAELAAAYRDPTNAPADLAVTYRDVLLAERARRTGPGYERDRAYWWDRLDDLPERPELPTALPTVSPSRRADSSASVVEPRFRRLITTLSSPAWSELRTRAGESGLTPTGAVLAAFAEVIGRWSRHPRFVLNVTVLNRPAIHEQIRRIVGDFTTVELLEVEVGFARPFGVRAQQIQARLWDDLDHSLVTGIDVVRERRRRDPEASSLFPVVFTSSVGLGRDPAAPAPASPDAWPGQDSGWLSRLAHGISQTPQVWLDCQVMETGSGLSVNWDVRDGVFPDGLMDTMFAAFTRLLRDLAAGVDAWQASCPVSVPVEQLERRPQPDLTAAVARRLPEAWLEQVRRHPDRLAVITPDRSLTYAELARWVAAVIHRLESWRCGPGDVVAVEMDKGWEQVAAVIGILCAGGTYVPVDTTAPRARRDRIIADVGARHLLTQSWLLDSVARPHLAAAAVDSLPEREESIVALGQADDLAYVMYTSGSTGTPKGVMVSHRAAWNTVDDINARFAIGPDDRVLGVAQLGFDLSVYDIFGPLSVGGAVVLPRAERRADPAHWVDVAASGRVTLWNSVPSQLEMLMAYLRSEPAATLDPLRLALLSGDWIPVGLPDQVWRRLPHVRLVSLGGATEAAIWSIVHPISTVEDGAPSIPYGRPLTRQSVEVLGDALAPVPDLVAGELYIGGAGLADGYFGDADRTAQRFVRHPATGRRLYRTGDLGRYLPDGSIEFLGREDSQVKIRGHRVELAEVEAALMSHAAVGAATVIATGRRPEPVRLAAFVEPANRRSADRDADHDHARGTDRARGTDPARGADLAVHALDESAPLRAEVDDGQMLAFARALQATGLSQMLCTLCECGLFADRTTSHDVAEVLSRARVAPRHHRLVRRWLSALRDNGLVLQEQGSGRFLRVADGDPATVRSGWDTILASVPDAEHRTELIGYFRTAADHLPQLLRGELDPLRLLFPEARTEIHEVAYTAMFLSRYLNRLLVSIATQLASRHRERDGTEPLRVLEVGSGVGGTSVELIPALDEFPVEYLFTDVSEFFLNNGRQRFGDYPWVGYRRFDLNADIRAQGLAPNTVDVIVCANVLHYATDAGAAVARLRELLQPGGWLLFIEATRDSYQIMTSMEFLFDVGSGDFSDVRRAGEQTFLTRAQWHEVLDRAGADDVVCLPERDAITDEMGMQVFAARFKSDHWPVSQGSLRAHLTQQLPAHMIPGSVQVVDRLPVTDNGKLDRRRLQGWLVEPGSDRRTGDDGEPAEGELEVALSRVWQRLLRVDRIGRNQNFFELGGDSLLAAQVAAQLRESVPAVANLYYDNLLRLLLENATVASLAARISEVVPESPVDPTTEHPLWRLVPLGDGTGTVTVLVPDAAGSLGEYRALLDRLGFGVPIVGFELADPPAYLKLGQDSLIEELAAECTRLLVAAGHDRVLVVGQRFGGVVAAELARHLTEVGVRVDRLIVVAPAASGDRTPDAQPIPLDGFDDGQDAERQLVGHSYSALAGFRLLPFAGDVTLLHPSGPGSEPTGAMLAHWQDVCLGDLAVIDVPGDARDVSWAAPRLSTLLATATGRP